MCCYIHTVVKYLLSKLIYEKEDMMILMIQQLLFVLAMCMYYTNRLFNIFEVEDILFYVNKKTVLCYFYVLVKKYPNGVLLY